MKDSFVPIGVIQGLSPDSMAKATESLIKIGYKYIALGGMVPQPADAVHAALSKITENLNQIQNFIYLDLGRLNESKNFISIIFIA